MRFLVVLALSLFAAPLAAQDMPPAFMKCQPCHALGEGAVNKVGPHLNGVVGQPVGVQSSYDYSQAMLDARAEGLEWTRQTLTRYLKLPRHLIPGTKMAFAGMTDRAEIDALIDYLASFSADGGRIEP